jgi:hypothetical protein
MSWRRSSRCGADKFTEQCVEVSPVNAPDVDAFLIRSSMVPDRTVLVSGDEWRAFILGVKAGDFDDLA